jgi:protein disulfide-isomerase
MNKMIQIGRTLLLVVSVAATFVACGQKPDSGRSPARDAATTTPSIAATNRSLLSRPFDEKADARKDIAAALAKAKADRKHVLLDFGANWCPDCLVLAKLLEDKSVKPFLEANFHLVKVNIGSRDMNLDIAQEYGNPIEKGIPAVVVLDPQGQVVTTTQGGELANARTATPAEILAYLKQWAPKKL